MIAPTEVSAGLIISGLRPFPWFFMNLIDRLLADYALSTLTVYVDASVEARYRPLAAQAGHRVAIKALPDGEMPGHGLIFRLEDTKAVTGLEWYGTKPRGANTKIRFAEGTRVLHTDVLGRTFDPAIETNRHGLDRSSSTFQKQSQLLDPLDGNFIFAPFVPQWRNPSEVGIAPFARHREDPFGFRMPLGTDATSRDPDAVVVLVYGGSAAYGLYTSEARSVTGWIRRLGAARLKAQGRSEKLAVLNLSVPSTTVTEASILHTLVGQRLRPDHVILHYGWNEPSATRHADLSRLAVDLPLSRPVWQFFHHFQDTGSDRRADMDYFWKHQNNPDVDVVSVVMDRTRLLSDTVRAAGGRFIVGIQPSPFQRRTPHPREAVLLSRYLAMAPINAESTVENLGGMRAMAAAAPAAIGSEDVIDFEPVFENLPATNLCFWDRAHMTTEGCRIVAEQYVDRMFGKA